MTYWFPVEYQDWLLMAFTAGYVWALLFPIWLAGLPYQKARSLAAFLNRRLYLYLICASGAAVFIFLIIIAACPDWTIDEYFKYIGIGFEELGRHVSVFASSGVVLLVFFLAFVLRDRIKILLGVENIYLFKCSTRECLSCFLLSAPSRPIEVFIHKVEELPSASLMSANDLFVELTLGSNEKVKTRVRKGAGASAVIKELLQLNYDPEDEDDKLIVGVKNQDMIMAQDIASLELSNRDINMIISIGQVQQFALFPQGKVHLGISYVDDAEENMGPASTLMGWFTQNNNASPTYGGFTALNQPQRNNNMGSF